ncbi:MAG: hypothetical protein VB051_11495, partial [Candidatus Pelethousia sp.]|nr:hypothetical protein [Candidatus Pelethousia sp.]
SGYATFLSFHETTARTSRSLFHAEKALASKAFRSRRTRRRSRLKPPGTAAPDPPELFRHADMSPLATSVAPGGCAAGTSKPYKLKKVAAATFLTRKRFTPGSP